jgi:UDP-glucose 4-epimerase
MGQVVLVTGVAGDLGRRFVAQLSHAPGVDRVIGVDVVPPRGDLGRAHFVRADIRNPVIAKVIVRERVDTVVHASVVATPAASGGRTSMKELNVIGTMQLLAACQQAPDLRKLVVKSSASVYGASNRDPAMFTEGMNAKRQPHGGFAKDVTEVESYVRGFARRRPDVAVTTLRMANVIGPRIVSGMTGYFRLPVIPTVLGFNPRMQFVHEDDALDVLQHATTGEVTGTYNVAGDGIITLRQAVRRLGRPSVPLPSFAISTFGSTIRQTGVADFSPEQVAFLTFGRGMDTTRMRSMLGFDPKFSTADAFADFASSVAPGLISADRVRATEGALVGALSRSEGRAAARAEGHPDDVPAITGGEPRG